MEKILIVLIGLLTIFFIMLVAIVFYVEHKKNREIKKIVALCKSKNFGRS